MTKRLNIFKDFFILDFRNITEGWKQTDKEKLVVMKKEYERYKDQWGLNLHYSHAAGPVNNFSEFLSQCRILLQYISAAKKEVELQVVHIYFDTSTFDRVEKDVKVILEKDELYSIICQR